MSIHFFFDILEFNFYSFCFYWEVLLFILCKINIRIVMMTWLLVIIEGFLSKWCNVILLFLVFGIKLFIVELINFLINKTKRQYSNISFRFLNKNPKNFFHKNLFIIYWIGLIGKFTFFSLTHVQHMLTEVTTNYRVFR